MKITRKLTLAIALTVLGASSASAQTYKKGDKLVNAGLGIGGGFGIPIGVSYEHGFTDRISGGGYLGYAGKNESFGDSGKWKYTYVLAAARVSYHFRIKDEKFDPYLGAILGYNIASVKWQGEEAAPASASAGEVIFGGHLGARYWLAEKIGIFGELGYGVGLLNLGVAFKL
ncbi:outer membrane beta-barrel protein [Pedobacter panaciterrae]|uniref:Outer membrane beta-barrel protein n=1 Tax=Pedobacter panaciterrae TaxID=363849 RepID=A0ABU8NQQ5_9SPHI|nr:outer membrane beta-barrel protein [Pedobacter panaciterrae]NQX54569.1 outer membrane beta-barrel protein [Pedobacter panaciterrae]